jgi:hypothetical protein
MAKDVSVFWLTAEDFVRDQSDDDASLGGLGPAGGQHPLTPCVVIGS